MYAIRSYYDWPGSVTGPLQVAIGAVLTNFSAGYPAEFRADIAGRATGSVWDFGDGTYARRSLHEFGLAQCLDPLV